MASKPEVGIRRKVTFQAWCHRCIFGWSGPEREFRGEAEFDRAGHEVDTHGGSWTRPSEAPHG